MRNGSIRHAERLSVPEKRRGKKNYKEENIEISKDKLF